MKIFKITISDAVIEVGSNPKKKEKFFKNERDARFFLEGVSEVDQRSQHKILKLEEIEVIE